MGSFFVILNFLFLQFDVRFNLFEILKIIKFKSRIFLKRYKKI